MNHIVGSTNGSYYSLLISISTSDTGWKWRIWLGKNSGEQRWEGTGARLHVLINSVLEASSLGGHQVPQPPAGHRSQCHLWTSLEDPVLHSRDRPYKVTELGGALETQCGEGKWLTRAHTSSYSHMPPRASAATDIDGKGAPACTLLGVFLENQDD